MSEYKLSLQSAFKKALTVKTIAQRLNGMRVVSNRIGRFLTFSNDTKILFVQQSIEDLARRNNVKVKELVRFLALHEIVTTTTRIRQRMASQTQENYHAAEIAIRIESTWLTRKINSKLKIYDEAEIENRIFESRSYYGSVRFTAKQFEFEDFHKAEYYYDILNKINSLGATTFLKSAGATDLLRDSTFTKGKQDRWEENVDYADFVDPIETDYPNVKTNTPADYSFNGVIDMLQEDLEEPIQFDDSPFIDVQHDKQESQSFGYDDGGNDFSFQKIDKRYSDADVILPGTVGSFENVAAIMDISSSMDLYDYSKVVKGIEEVLLKYNSIDMFPANTHVSRTFVDVNTSNYKSCLDQIYVGGETNMLNVAREVMRFGANNNRRYTHVFVFTDGQTSYEDLTVFGEANVFLYITDPRISPPKGVAYRII